MNYKLHITKIQSVAGIHNRFLIFIDKLNEINKDLHNPELEEMIGKLSSTAIIGHLPEKLHDTISGVSLLIGYEDDRTIELLNIFSEMRKIMDSVGFLYDIQKTDEDIKEMDKRQEALSNIDHLQE